MLAEGPVPVIVSETRPLSVRGRFSAPSFDIRVLNDVLAQSRALVDWQVTLGKTVTRSESAREKVGQPDLLVVDAAWFERAAAPARAALLEQVKQGASLLVLAANANDAGIWSRSLQLPLQAQAADKLTNGPLPLPVAPLTPATRIAGAWTGQDNAVWARQWGKGRIGWLGAADWHRLAITEPRALALWWQGVLDTRARRTHGRSPVAGAARDAAARPAPGSLRPRRARQAALPRPESDARLAAPPATAWMPPAPPCIRAQRAG